MTHISPSDASEAPALQLAERAADAWLIDLAGARGCKPFGIRAGADLLAAPFNSPPVGADPGPWYGCLIGISAAGRTGITIYATKQLGEARAREVLQSPQVLASGDVLQEWCRGITGIGPAEQRALTASFVNHSMQPCVTTLIDHMRLLIAIEPQLAD
jgi:hypothetical protein